jgi:tartrate dehydrogenase/decarboxylase/D-malate dehydrogenase
MKTFNVAVIAGDGIGKEVVPEGIRVLEVAGKRFGFQFRWQKFDWSSETYVKTGKMMPPDGLQQLRPCDAIFWEPSAIRVLQITSPFGGC